MCGAILGDETFWGRSVGGYRRSGSDRWPPVPMASPKPVSPATACSPSWCSRLSSGLGPPPSVLELYAGSGNLTRALLGLGGTVLAVEGEPRAAARLREVGPQPTGRAATDRPRPSR
jgi:hypothetical protein